MFSAKQTKQSMFSFAEFFTFPERSHCCLHVHGFLKSPLSKGCFYKGLMNGMHLLQLFRSEFKHRVALNYRTGFRQHLEFTVCCSLSARVTTISNCFRSSVLVMCHLPSRPALLFPLINVILKWTQLKLHAKGFYVVYII